MFFFENFKLFEILFSELEIILIKEIEIKKEKHFIYLVFFLAIFSFLNETYMQITSFFFK